MREGLCPFDPLTITVEQEPTGKDEVAVLRQYLLSTGRWSKTTLSLVFTVLVLVCAVLAFALGRVGVFMPGTLSKAHQGFHQKHPTLGQPGSVEEQGARTIQGCDECHPPWKLVWTSVSDKTCENCHRNPAHFGEKASSSIPACAICHLEHKGQPILAAVPEQYCVQCHADLKIQKGQPEFAEHIRDFSTDHPEFKVTVISEGGGAPGRVSIKKMVDAAQIRLNHRLHLNPDKEAKEFPQKAIPHEGSKIKNSEGTHEQLGCRSCHEEDSEGASIKPVQYTEHCARCHGLDFDSRLPGETIPHGIQPKAIRPFLEGKFFAFVKSSSEAERRLVATAKRLPGRVGQQAELLMKRMVSEIEAKLYKKRTKQYCYKCHSLEERSNVARRGTGLLLPKESLPRVITPNIPDRWFPHSFFVHRAHFRDPRIGEKDQGCLSCHGEVGESRETKDVLMPGIATCRTCHSSPGGVRAECGECHYYHVQKGEPGVQARKSGTPHIPLLAKKLVFMD